MSITRRAAGTFYGVTVGYPTIDATVGLEAQSPWIGEPALKTAVSGQLPENGGTVTLAVQNAIGGSSRVLHDYLDKLTERRGRRLEEEFRKKSLEKKKSGPVAKNKG